MLVCIPAIGTQDKLKQTQWLDARYFGGLA